MTNPLTKLAKKLAGPIVRKVLTGKVRAAAEGKLGDTPDERARWKAAYWWLVGKKRVIGAILGAATAVLAAFPVTAPSAPYVGTLAALMLSWGLLDMAWRDYRPAWLSAPLARFVAAHPAELGGAFTAAFAWQRSDCTGGWCSWLGAALVALAALAVYYGFLDSAWRAPGPREGRSDL